MAAELAYSEIGSEPGKDRLQEAYESCSTDDILSNSLLRKKVYRIAYKILGNEADAEDAVQEAYLNIWRGLPNFRGDSKFSTWASRITVNTALRFLRKRRKTESYSLEQMREDAEFDISDKRVFIDRDVANSELAEKDVVKLHDYEGYTIREITRILGVPEGTVKSRLFYGRLEFERYAEWSANGLKEFLIGDEKEIATVPKIIPYKNGNNHELPLETAELIKHERMAFSRPEHYFKPSYLDASNIF